MRVRVRVVAPVAVALVALGVIGSLVGIASPAGTDRQGEPARAAASKRAVTLRWLGWSHFRLTSASGKVILLNPWATNPDSPVKPEQVTRADLIYAPNGHLDEIGETVDIARRTGAKVFAPAELLS
jgi:hypothetical protein